MTIFTKIAIFWSDALAVFSAVQIRLFLALTLKAAYNSYSLLVKRVPWLWLGYAIAVWFGRGFTLVNTAFLFVALCATRSSVAKKNSVYFVYKAWQYFVPYALLAITLTYGFLGKYVFTSWFALLLDMHIGAFVTLYGLFLLDTPLSFKHLSRVLVHAFYFFFYNYPVVLTIEALKVGYTFLSVVALPSLFSFAEPSLFFYISLLFQLLYVPFYIACMATFYLRRVYEQGIYYV